MAAVMWMDGVVPGEFVSFTTLGCDFQATLVRVLWGSGRGKLCNDSCAWQ